MEFKKKVLDNGLTILFERRDTSVTTVMMAVKYGFAYDSLEEKGMAHFIEHLCFKGTKKRSAKEISSALEGVGGELNAFTHEEITNYHVKLPSEHLGLAIDVISDIFFNPIFPDEEVKRESRVICEEIKMYKDNPRAHVLDSIKSNLYESPFGISGLGFEENVLSMTRNQILEKHNKIYNCKNAILCVVGNNDFEEVVKLAESMDVKEGDFSPEIKTPILKIKKDYEKREGIEQVNLAIGFHFPYSSEDRKYAAEVFNAILGKGMSSKLFTEVREKRGLVYGIKTELDLGKNYGYMIIWAGTEHGKEEEVVKISLEEFSKMKDITEDELKRAKVQVIGNRHVESEGSSETAVNLIFEEMAGDAENYYKYEEKINLVSLEDIKKLAEISEYSLFSLGP